MYRTLGTRRLYTAWLQRLEEAGVEELTLTLEWDIQNNRRLLQVKRSAWLRVIAHGVKGKKERFLYL